MPGNHDSLVAVDLWERIDRDKPDNVILATKAEPIDWKAIAAILPAPPSVRSHGFDLTEWMGHADTGERIRIGLAHGGVTDFGSEDGGLATIPPNRADLSELDYLALGDWHGQMAIGPKSWYAGLSRGGQLQRSGCSWRSIGRDRSKRLCPPHRTNCIGALQMAATGDFLFCWQ